MRRLRRCAKPISFTNLQDFLDIYYQGMSVLITEQDFYDLAWCLSGTRARRQSRHVEMFFDPQGHTARGIAFSTVINGLHRAIVDAGQKFGVQASLIMCFLRHLDEADAEKTLDAALAFKDRIVGVGLDSSEAGTPAKQIQARVSIAPATRASFCRRMPARRGRRAMSGKRSTCSASRGSITAFARWKIRRWWEGWRGRRRPADGVSAVKPAAAGGRRPGKTSAAPDAGQGADGDRQFR